MSGRQPGPGPQITIESDGGLHFNGSTEELHSYIDKLNQGVAWMNSHWEQYLSAQELGRVAEIRALWSDDSAGISELTSEGWPPNGSFPEPGTQAFEWLREISQFHRIAEGRMIEEAEIREREEAKAGTNPETSTT